MIKFSEKPGNAKRGSAPKPIAQSARVKAAQAVLAGKKPKGRASKRGR